MDDLATIIWLHIFGAIFLVWCGFFILMITGGSCKFGEPPNQEELNNPSRPIRYKKSEGDIIAGSPERKALSQADTSKRGKFNEK